MLHQLVLILCYISIFGIFYLQDLCYINVMLYTINIKTKKVFNKINLFV